MGGRLAHLKHKLDTQFESIESAQEFLKLLAAAIIDARLDVESDVRTENGSENRRLQALQLALYKLQQLEKHLKTSQRLLNDLRSLRRLLFEERAINRKASKPDASHADALELDGAC